MSSFFPHTYLFSLKLWRVFCSVLVFAWNFIFLLICFVIFDFVIVYCSWQIVICFTLARRFWDGCYLWIVWKCISCTSARPFRLSFVSTAHWWCCLLFFFFLCSNCCVIFVLLFIFFFFISINILCKSKAHMCAWCMREKISAICSSFLLNIICTSST